MTDVLLGLACASFILAVACAIIAVVVYVKFDVADAIRFLRSRKSGRGYVPASQGSKRRPAKAANTVAQKRGMVDAASVIEFPKPTPVINLHDTQEQKDLIEESEQDTSLLVEEESENPTTLLMEEETERPTSLLEDEEEAERPTSLLEEESENPTTLLEVEESEKNTTLLEEDKDAERPTSLLVEEESERLTTVLQETDESERPTSLLEFEEESEQPTSILTETEEEENVSKGEHRGTALRDTFKFVIKKKVLAVNTEEVIDEKTEQNSK